MNTSKLIQIMNQNIRNTFALRVSCSYLFSSSIALPFIQPIMVIFFSSNGSVCISSFISDS